MTLGGQFQFPELDRIGEATERELNTWHRCSFGRLFAKGNTYCRGNRFSNVSMIFFCLTIFPITLRERKLMRKSWKRKVKWRNGKIGKKKSSGKTGRRTAVGDGTGSHVHQPPR